MAGLPEGIVRKRQSRYLSLRLNSCSDAVDNCVLMCELLKPPTAGQVQTSHAATVQMLPVVGPADTRPVACTHAHQHASYAQAETQGVLFRCSPVTDHPNADPAMMQDTPQTRGHRSPNVNMIQNSPPSRSQPLSTTDVFGTLLLFFYRKHKQALTQLKLQLQLLAVVGLRPSVICQRNCQALLINCPRPLVLVMLPPQ